MLFSTKIITVEFGCIADRPKVLADLSDDINFAYTYMDLFQEVLTKFQKELQRQIRDY